MRRHLIVVGLLLGPVAAAQTPAARPAAGLELTYLANEGVLLSSGDRQVILDGLFRFYRDAFPLAPDSVRAALEHARPPFDGIDLVLVTHRHGDHFHPTDVARHLEANSDAILLTSAQVIDSLRGSLTDPARTAGRLRAPVVAAGGRHREVVNGITVDLLGIPHGPTRQLPDHRVYLVELGGVRVLHLGDADLAPERYAAFRLDTARIDVALVPQWMLLSDEGRRTIERHIRPRQVVAFHFPADGAERVAERVRRAWPGAIALLRPLERHRF